MQLTMLSGTGNFLITQHQCFHVLQQLQVHILYQSTVLWFYTRLGTIQFLHYTYSIFVELNVTSTTITAFDFTDQD